MATLKLEELQQELEEDCKITTTNLQSEASRIPVIWSKWLRYHSDGKKKLIQLQAEKEATIKDRMLFYTGRHDSAMSDVVYTGASEIKIAISGDPAVLKVNKLIQYYEMIGDFTGKALDIIKNKSYAIKNMVEIRKLESGG